MKRMCSSSQRLNISKFWSLTCFGSVYSDNKKNFCFEDVKSFVLWPFGASINITLAPPPSLSSTKLLCCQMAKVSSKRSPMSLSSFFANNRRVKSTKGHCLASWWYSTWINVIVTVPKSCYCNTLMKGPTDEIDGTRLKSWCKVCFCACRLNCFSCVRLFATLWTVAHQTLLSMGFSRQEYWSRLPFPLPGDLPNLGIKPSSRTCPA